MLPFYAVPRFRMRTRKRFAAMRIILRYDLLLLIDYTDA